MHRFSVLFLLVASPVFGLVVTEIMYNQPPTPADPEGIAEDLEWLELYNEKAEPEDLTGFRFTQGIHYQFPGGFRGDGKPFAALGPREYLVLASDAAAFTAKYGFAPFGQFEGHLGNGGDDIVMENDAGDPHVYDPTGTLVEHRREGGRYIDFSYDDEGKWPVGADGCGHTLCLIDPFGDQDDPDNWTASPTLWGTPGQPNGLQDQWIETTIFPTGSSWRYFKGTSEPPAAWKDRTFTDTGWLGPGQAPIGFGEAYIATTLGDMGGVGGYLSFYARISFTVANPAQIENLALSVLCDDGFVAYLNGTEVYRNNVAGNPPAYNTAAGPAIEASLTQYDITSFKGQLIAGTNVIAIQTHNSSLTSSDAVMDASLASRRLIRGGVGSSDLVFNEVYYQTSSGRFVEIHNTSASPIALTNYYLSDNPANLKAHALSGQIAGKGFVAVAANANLPLALEPPEPGDPDPGFGTLRVFLSYEDPAEPGDMLIIAGENVSGRILDGWSQGRYPDGGAKWLKLSVPTQGTANQLSANDVATSVVINELMFHPFREDDPYTTADDAVNASNLEYLELYNRGATAVDMTGWYFTRGITYTFPEGLLFMPGTYLVLAKNPTRIKEVYGLETVLGPYQGVLANGGETIRLRSANHNTANEVHYYDSGRWEKWADGLGSSLELIDPDQDNSFDSAWAASDESAKSTWTTVSYDARHNDTTWNLGGESEIHLYLMGRGEVLLDELKFSTSPSFTTNLAPGGSFNTATDFTNNWIRTGDTGGNHIDSHWTNQDAYAGAGCLKIVASGRGDSGWNRLEAATTSGLSAGTTYYVQYRARWLRGFNLIMTRTHGHGVARSSPILVPDRLGTPGAQNSMYQANMGPVYRYLNQSPVVPNASEPVNVTVEASDADGVASVVTKYRLDTAGTYSQVSMNDSGTGADAAAGDGVWTGTIPGQAAGSIVEFYVEGTDGASRTTQYPPLPPAGAPSTVLKDLAIYRVGDRQAVGNRAIYRITLTRDAQAALLARRTLSNHLLPCSFVLNEKTIFYNCGQRFRGSPFIRGGGTGGTGNWNGIRIRFPSDQRLFGKDRELNLDYTGAENLHDRTAYYLERKLVAATPGVYASWSYGRYATMRYKAGTLEQVRDYDHIQKIDGDYLRYWWRDHEEGTLHKIDDWFEFNNDSQNFTNRQADMAWHGRLGAVSATVAAGGTGYLVGNDITLTGGTFGTSAIFNVDSVGGSGQVTGVSLVRGGDYAPPPSNPVSTTGGTGTGCRLDVTWGTDITNKEDHYRQQWKLRSREKDDDFSDLIDLHYALNSWPVAQLDRDIQTIMDVRQWSTILCPRIFICDWDTLGYERGKNAYVYLPSPGTTDPVGGGGWEGNWQTWQLIPWDSDWTFDTGRVNNMIYPGYSASFPLLKKLFDRPWARRMINADYRYLIDEVLTPAHLSAWVNWVGTSVPVAGAANVLTFCQSRSTNILGRLPSDAATPFDITSPRGNPYVSNVATINVDGTAPSNVDSIAMDGTPIDDQIIWSGANGTAWRYNSLGLQPGLNEFQFDALRRDGVVIATKTLRILYTSQDPPEITDVWPREGVTIGGESVRITGSNFKVGATVKLGDTVVTDATRVSDTEIRIMTPSHAAGQVVVTVTNPDNLPAFFEYFTYIPIPAPRVALLFPDRGYQGGGTRVQIRGNYFQTGVRVFLGGVEVSPVTYRGLQELEVVTPAHAAGLVNVRVLNTDAQEDTLANGFRYLPDRAPVLDSVTPGEGPTGGGTRITVRGSNFVNGAFVVVGAATATLTTFVSSTELTCSTPAAQPGDSFVSVRVENPDGQYAWDPSAFRYVSGVVSCERGDANGDGLINIADGVAILDRLFRHGQNVRCERAADHNLDETLDIADAISLFAYLFPRR